MTPSSSSAGSNQRDLALADAVLRKDRKATAEFVEQYADAVYGYVLSRVRPNAADAEDLTQEVFLAACQGIGNYRGSSSLKSWLVGIARHKIDDYYRQRMRDLDLGEVEELADTSIELDAALDESRRRDRTLAALDRVPEAYRLLLKWRYWDHKTEAEMAGMLGRTPKAVERMLARARERFRREWKQDNE